MFSILLLFIPFFSPFEFALCSSLSFSTHRHRQTETTVSYYVDALNGTDSGGCSTEQFPCRTLPYTFGLISSSRKYDSVSNNIRVVLVPSSEYVLMSSLVLEGLTNFTLQSAVNGVLAIIRPQDGVYLRFGGRNLVLRDLSFVGDTVSAEPEPGATGTFACSDVFVKLIRSLEEFESSESEMGGCENCVFREIRCDVNTKALLMASSVSDSTFSRVSVPGGAILLSVQTLNVIQSSFTESIADQIVRVTVPANQIREVLLEGIRFENNTVSEVIVLDQEASQCNLTAVLRDTRVIGNVIRGFGSVLFNGSGIKGIFGEGTTIERNFVDSDGMFWPEAIAGIACRNDAQIVALSARTFGSGNFDDHWTVSGNRSSHSDLLCPRDSLSTDIVCDCVECALPELCGGEGNVVVDTWFGADVFSTGQEDYPCHGSRQRPCRTVLTAIDVLDEEVTAAELKTILLKFRPSDFEYFLETNASIARSFSIQSDVFESNDNAMLYLNLPVFDFSRADSITFKGMSMAYDFIEVRLSSASDTLFQDFEGLELTIRDRCDECNFRMNLLHVTAPGDFTSSSFFSNRLLKHRHELFLGGSVHGVSFDYTHRNHPGENDCVLRTNPTLVEVNIDTMALSDTTNVDGLCFPLTYFTESISISNLLVSTWYNGSGILVYQEDSLQHFAPVVHIAVEGDLLLGESPAVMVDLSDDLSSSNPSSSSYSSSESSLDIFLDLSVTSLEGGTDGVGMVNVYNGPGSMFKSVHVTFQGSIEDGDTSGPAVFVKGSGVSLTLDRPTSVSNNLCTGALPTVCGLECQDFPGIRFGKDVVVEKNMKQSEVPSNYHCIDSRCDFSGDPVTQAILNSMPCEGAPVPKKKIPVGIIAGSVSGSVVLLLCAVLVCLSICCLCMCSRQKREQQPETGGRGYHHLEPEDDSFFS